ncbi:ABC transporter G family member 14 [Penicillium subrubescens]|uniref:ABC transporter G family member 14 n=1 Tax=Penicillium subrubescens TaxID=1316194 RepID=A0A1Q5TDL5_9EURO|nr:ABC transporter G family member 14 [Penicillium subrubescens]
MGDSMDPNQSIESEMTPENHQNNANPSSECTIAKTSPLSRSDNPDIDGSIQSTASSEPEMFSEGESLNNGALAKTLSSRRSHASGHEGAEWAQIERLISRMFGHERKANSEEEQTRHVGVIWKNLTVKGLGLGAALQPTNGDIFFVLYNPEDDLHYATLTVRDTLLFALKTRTPDKPSRIPGETRKDYQQTFLSAIAKLFWIEHALGTRVGNELIRGISGGEKKRVSIGEAMVTKASTQCWDNSTRGLDASTALEYVQSLRSLTNTAHVSTLVALYQASENLFNLFDKVILIEGGKCAFFGRTEEAKAYFENLGFECPPRWTTPDFLTSVSDPNARRVKPGWEDRIPRTADEFQATYRQSDVFKVTLTDIESFEDEIEAQKHEREAARSKETKKNYTVPFWKQVTILTHRQFLVMFGDRAALAGKWGVLVFQALIVGSLFYNLPNTSSGVFTRGGVMFFILLFNALLALAELTAAFESRPILMKHKSFSFYRPAAYALAQVVVDVPLVFIQVVLFDVIVYLYALRQELF